MKVLASYSIKGGVGKTTASVNLAYALALSGQRTLLIDLDPQGAAGFYFKVKAKKKFKASTLIDKKKSLLEQIRESDYPHLDVLPSLEGYRHLDIALDGQKKKDMTLKRNLSELKEDYDWIVLDSPPNLTLLTENIFNAADILLIPVIPSPLSERTFAQVLNFTKDRDYRFKEIRAFFSLVEKRRKVHQEFMEEMKAKYPDSFFNSIVPRSADVERMGIYREPVQCFAPKSLGGKAYGELTGEIIAFLTQ